MNENYKQQPDTSSQTVRNGDSYNLDTREQLEADMERLVEDAMSYGWKQQPRISADAIELLDRQAEITRRECERPNWDYCETCEALDELTAERERYRDNMLVQMCKVAELTAERDYWRDEVQYCMDSAYPKSHAPERGYDQNVMAYPDRKGCTTPSTLVSAVIDKLRDAAQDGFYASKFGDVVRLTAERDELQAAIDAMNNGQFYAMYRAKCEECEEAVSFAKRLENAVKDGQPVTLFGVDYEKPNKKLLAEHERLTKKLKRLRRRLSKLRKERDYLQKVVKTQADSFKKLEIELAGKDG